jgi:hypothetical protein
VGYVAKAPVVKVSVGEPGGNRIARILRAGAAVPEGVAQEQLDSLEARDLIEKSGDQDDVDDATEVSFDGPPAKSAGKDVWEAYARSRGFTDEELAGLKKPDLIEKATNGKPAAEAEEDEQSSDDEDDES